ncbi:PIN domain-containing protein [Roseibacterium sp. SDUM158017]|uniref:RSP_2648 family PIN domain-containing protein n=1 Tax=Roseicyclus salinarum TaxID=3036773 RepID=UPI002415025E|nr:PIN domain-containing protein [Roseibacterium sp. SDUM158017]MDG4648122.1 PIN domain-containing protein [Roseibacterium sp. SDUM158017]
MRGPGGRWVLDACVLYPTVLREILLGCAAAGMFAPAWSPRLLEEWARVAERQGGAADAALARGEIARLRAKFPGAEVAHRPEDEAALWLPDATDIHVLATARAAGARGIVTLNLRDFPRAEMTAHDLVAVHPDSFLLDLMAGAPDTVAEVVGAVHKEAERLSGDTLDLRGVLKRVRLPRLARALTR